MKLSTKQKAYVSVLALGVTALAFDRAFLLGPQQATGGVRAVQPASLPAVAVADTSRSVSTTGGLSTPHMNIADRLDTLAEAREFDLMGVPDVFRPSPAWLPREPVVEGPVSGRPSVATIPGSLRLTAVMASGQGGYAIINGEFLFIGDMIDGYRLVEVRARSVVLESNGTAIELTLPEQM